MEILRKDIKQKTKIERISGNYNIVPDLSVNYCLRFLLTSDNKDLGIFDSGNKYSNDLFSYEDISLSDAATTIPPEQTYWVTGTSNSRLNELKISAPILQYIVYDGYNDGVDYINSNSEKWIYNIGDIEYVDNLLTNVTTFKFKSKGTAGPQFMSIQIYKTPTKENMVGIAKTNADVFIDRQELSIFDRIYKLEFMKNLDQLENFVGGGYYNIVKIT